MYFPDYAAGSLVNLMRSIGSAFAAPATPYAGLEQLEDSEFAGRRTVILLVIDGLGYEYVQTHGKLLRTHCHARLTSVFPSTTATSISTFLTGLAPQQHGLTGWFTYLREVGGVTAVLPAQLRGSQEHLSSRNVDIGALYGHIPFFDLLDVNSYIVSPAWIIDTDFNRAHCGKARSLAYDDLESMLGVVQQLARDTSHNKYVYAYWPDFDRLSHQHGNASEAVLAHFRELEQGIETLVRNIQGSDTLLLITADHGFIDTGVQHMITVNDHPRLHETLVLPLCGEPRVAFCYVDPYKVEQFRNYIDDNFSRQIECIESPALIGQDVFGLGEPHPRLHERVGHYTLLMKDNYIIKDWLVGERRFFNTGVHGGTSEQEMFVPLIGFSC